MQIPLQFDEFFDSKNIKLSDFSAFWDSYYNDSIQKLLGHPVNDTQGNYNGETKRDDDGDAVEVAQFYYCRTRPTSFSVKVGQRQL